MDRVVANEWIAVISAQELHLAAQLRQMQGVSVLVPGDRIWLRGPLKSRFANDHLTDDDLARRLLRILPGVRPYLLAEDGQLIRVGERVPSAQLPEGKWQPIANWLKLQLPRAMEMFSGIPSPVPLSLIRSSEERAATILIVSFAVWLDYAQSAPQWRLERLVFATDSAQRVVIRGTPLPALPGERWVERDGIATPGGWQWDPPVDAKILSDKFGIQSGEVILLGHSDWQVVRCADWVRATRSAVRATLKEWK